MLHRLHLLQKHHADEQFLARRQVRTLPADITRLERRLAALTQDIATAAVLKSFVTATVGGAFKRLAGTTRTVASHRRTPHHGAAPA